MKKENQIIQIEKSFFNLNSSVSVGLISGLKELLNLGYKIRSSNFNIDEDSCLQKIFKIEGIKISTVSNSNAAFLISTKGKQINSINISPKGKIKNFAEAVNEIKTKMRSAKKIRTTKETQIKINVSLDGNGKSKINTGIGFFDHMIEQIARHSNININLKAKGDLHIDEHHTVEDVGITLGSALNDALGTKTGIKRYGFFLPMDDSVAVCTIDLGGRAYLNFNCKFNREFVGNFPTELTEEFFKALASGLKANIYIKAKGINDHHKIEAIFKAFAKALNEACRLDERSAGKLPTTKGLL